MGDLLGSIFGTMLFFALLIAGLAWMYGAQSAQRRQVVEGGRTASKKSVR